MSRTTTCIPAQPELPRRLRAAGYARVSSGKDAMLQSLSAQVSYYNSYIQRRRDWVYAGVFVDEAVTGTRDSRQGFQRLLDACRAGEIDVIVTKSISRFARNTVTLLETIRELRALEVNVFFEREGIYSMSADGELLLTLLASFAQEESLSCSENCKWRIRKDFQEGRPNTGNMLGYHLVDGVLTIIPEEAALVQQVFADYLSGMGLQAIANKYRRQGINFSTSGLAKMLRNEKYAGNLLLQKTFRLDHISKKGMINRGELPMYFVEGSHEPIIPKAQFAHVQAEIARRHLRWGSSASPSLMQDRAQYPFTGLITCGACGACYRRKHANAGSKYEKIVWICETFNTRGKAHCASQQIPEDILTAKAEEAGGMDGLEEVLVTGKNALTFFYADGRQASLTWAHPSRRKSWTPEMREAARQKSLAQHRGEADEQ